ncbi:MAG TPA: DUF5615 family PIN-like protein [Candidatus Polarisedimenticolia bacterium]|nr:DUF5615 family PIN-like protein [Candidatus Polarisedimenticolia bacterium]
MRILANENFPRPVVDTLRRSGHDVAWIKELHPGLSDPDILEMAGSESRIVATFDKDFGALAFEEGIPATTGIILIRIGLAHDLIASRVLAALKTDCPWQGHLATIEPGRIRLRALPQR